MPGFLSDVPTFWAFAAVWVGAVAMFMVFSLVRLGLVLRRDRQAIGRFFEAGGAMPVLALYHLGGERAATYAGMQLLAAGPRSRATAHAEVQEHPLLASLRTAADSARGSGTLEEVRASSRFPAFRSELRRAARRGLPAHRTRGVPGVREGWAAVCGLVAVLALGVGFYGRQAGGSGLWFMIALAVHVPVAVWLFVADGRREPDQWPEFTALCQRCATEAGVRASGPERAAGTGSTAASGWAGDGGVGASGSCGGGCGGGT
ncbi:hypothetical protein OHA57_37045 [Streptomyces anulatus]|uniref:hypothetical protein n=1 Tax=Streptomyces anulatus TaxID=1892 RepID=UPI002DDC2312|nr:hypothetical protein [Streptomyces anulatus]WSC66037.1 hypothetical protein OHA57_37045 [Streptomyces anulatus]